MTKNTGNNLNGNKSEKIFQKCEDILIPLNLKKLKTFTPEVGSVLDPFLI